MYHNLETESESGSVVSDSLQPHIIHGILQARILEWVAFPFPWGSSQPTEPPGKNTSEGETNIWTRKNSVNETFKGEKLSSNKGEETDILTHEGTNPLGFEGTGGLQNTETVEMNILK